LREELVVTTNAPTPSDVDQLLFAMRHGRDRLLALANGDGVSPDEIVSAIDEIGEHLLVADEELRVQNEYITQSTQRLDLLVAMHEELFTNAPSAYLQSDVAGRVLRFNAAARRLLQLDPTPGQPVLMTSLVRPDDRSTIRDIATALRSASTTRAVRRTQPFEVVVQRGDGRQLPAVISARRSTDGVSGRFLLHWEIQETAPIVTTETHNATRALQAITEAAAIMNDQQTTAMTLQHVVQMAGAAVPHSEQVGVTLIRSRSRVETPAATGDLAAACDELQYTLREGPCLHAAKANRPVRVDDMTRERRWPRFAPRAASLGVRSMLVLPLAAARGTVGALNLYSRRVNAFDPDDELIGQSFATHAAIALVHVELEQNLRVGLETRQEIGQAVGILMERHRLNPSAAFELLVEASQRSHMKLRDIANRMVETGEDPTTFT